MAIGDSFTSEGAASDTATMAREHDDAMFAKRVMDVPHNLQMRLDYTGTPTGQPLYPGYGAKGLGVGDEGWLIYKFTYDGNDMVTLRQSQYTNWTARASGTYE